jgi:hypothetical protein
MVGEARSHPPAFAAEICSATQALDMLAALERIEAALV